MKPTTSICLVVSVAVCFLAIVVSGTSHHHHHEEKATKSQWTTINCPLIDLEETDDGGTISYYGAKKRDGSYCNIQINGPPGQSIRLDVYMENAGGAMFPDCNDGGRLSIYNGADATGSLIVTACDALPVKTFHVHNNQVYTEFTQDAVGDNFIIQFTFENRRSAVEDLNAKLESMLDQQEEKNGEREHHHHHHHHKHD